MQLVLSLIFLFFAVYIHLLAQELIKDSFTDRKPKIKEVLFPIAILLLSSGVIVWSLVLLTRN